MTCSDCSAERNVMIGMKPGRDGAPWWLCVGCWVESTRPLAKPAFGMTRGKR